MKTFPKKLECKNRDQFKEIHYERVKAYLRRDLYEHILSHEEKEYFDLEKFGKERLTNINLLKKMVEEVCKELGELNWKTQLSYGGTGLFIFSDKPPSNCYPDGLI